MIRAPVSLPVTTKRLSPDSMLEDAAHDYGLAVPPSEHGDFDPVRVRAFAVGARDDSRAQFRSAPAGWVKRQSGGASDSRPTTPRDASRRGTLAAGTAIRK